MHYVQINQVNPRVNVRSETVDLVTCFMSIHHFKDQTAMFAEIARILKPDGYLFVREHDADQADTEFVDFLTKMH